MIEEMEVECKDARMKCHLSFSMYEYLVADDWQEKQCKMLHQFMKAAKEVMKDAITKTSSKSN